MTYQTQALRDLEDPLARDHFRNNKTNQIDHLGSVQKSSSVCVKKIVFINPKGGVGKSTLALLTSIALASRSQREVAMLDLDSQATSSRSLKRFENDRLRIYGSSEFMHETGIINSWDIASFIPDSKNDTTQFLVVDTPASVAVGDYPFLSSCDFIFVPTSCSDADVFATQDFLKQLFNNGISAHSMRPSRKPFFVMLPNQVISKKDVSEMRIAFQSFPVLFGKPLTFSMKMRKAFRPDSDDKSLIKVLKHTSNYFDWMNALITESLPLPSKVNSFYQL